LVTTLATRRLHKRERRCLPSLGNQDKPRMMLMSLETTNPINSSYWPSLQNVMKCNATLMQLAFNDVRIALDYARVLPNVRSTLDFDDAVINYTRDQFDALFETLDELSVHLQNGLPENKNNMTLSFWD
jgi:hypothetical protein